MPSELRSKPGPLPPQGGIFKMSGYSLWLPCWNFHDTILFSQLLVRLLSIADISTEVQKIGRFILTYPGIGQCRGLRESLGPLDAGQPAVLRLVIVKMGFIPYPHHP